MSDQYPTNFAIEIDRPRLLKYLRTKWFLLWTGSMTALSAFVGLSGLGEIAGGSVAALNFVRDFGILVGGAGLVGVLLYLVLGQWLAARIANSLEVSVEGSFLRIRQHNVLLTGRTALPSDCGLLDGAGGIVAEVQYAAPPNEHDRSGVNSIILLFGIKDCEKVRDMLADIDRLRENE